MQVETTYRITDFGAIADGVTNNAWAIQRAIDACAANGGGRVSIPAGTFLSGKVYLRSKIELHLEAGATLLCSPHFEDIQGDSESRGLRTGFVCGDKLEDVAISGEGVLDGNGKSYIKEHGTEIHVMNRARPRTLVLMGCSRITITGITVRDGAEWTLWFCGCTDLTIDHIRLENDRLIPNSDGLDIDHCRNVRITDSHISAGDDGIVLKATRNREDYGPCENITVKNCTLESSSSALCIGCEVFSPIRKVVFDSCVIKDSNRGLSINQSSPVDIEDVVFSNITIETRRFDERWWGAGEPIYVKALPWEEGEKVGRVRHVRFKNIRARSESGVLVWGEEPDRIEDIVFENVHVGVDKWTKYPGGKLDLRPMPGKENGYFTSMIARPTTGILLHNAGGVTLRKVDVTLSAAVADAGRKGAGDGECVWVGAGWF